MDIFEQHLDLTRLESEVGHHDFVGIVECSRDGIARLHHGGWIFEPGTQPLGIPGARHAEQVRADMVATLPLKRHHMTRGAAIPEQHLGIRNLSHLRGRGKIFLGKGVFVDLAPAVQPRPKLVGKDVGILKR